MNSQKIETQSVNIDTKVNMSEKIVHLSDVNSSNWSGVIFLPENTLPSIHRNGFYEIYILEGKIIDHNQIEYEKGTFLVRPTLSDLKAGSSGAVLFIYRDEMATFQKNFSTFSSNQKKPSF